MEQTITTDTATQAKRPQFLNVLCILSFIGTGIGLLMGIYHLFTAGQTQAAVAALEGMTSSAGENMGDNAATDVMGSMMAGAVAAAKYAYVLAAIEIVANLLCLGGVVMMWKLKKSGYYLYVLGQVLSIVVPIVLVGGGIFGGFMVVMAIFPIAFIIMYGLNLKHMH